MMTLTLQNPLMAEVDFGNDEVPDLHERLEELRRYGPVVPVIQWGAPSWLVLNYREVKQVFNDSINFSPSAFTKKYASPSQGTTLLAMDGDEHRKHRTIVAPPFLPAAVRAFTERSMEPIVHELLDRIEGEQEVDFIEAFTRPFPFTVITRLLGIPVVDEAMCLVWALKLIEFPWDPEGALKAKNEFDDYMEDIIRERRANPGEDIISLMVRAKVDGQDLSHEEILSFARLLFPAGSDTTYKNGGSLFSCVLADAELSAMAHQDDKARAALVAEGLRWQPPVALQPRLAMGDVILSGADIKAGDHMLVGIASANRDPAVFAEPSRFNPHRDNSGIITFGQGAHFCLGMHLARRELETALRVVFQRFPKMALSSSVPTEYVGGMIRGPRALQVRPYGPVAGAEG